MRAGMPGVSYSLLETPLGVCALGWSAVGVRWVGLPELSLERLRQRVHQRFQETREVELSGDSVSWAQYITTLTSGITPGPLHIPLDLTGVSAFYRRVYAAAQQVGFGQTSTYGALARQLGSPGAARAVGQALGRNPIPLIVPCHRILGAAGLGGFSAEGGVTTKLRLLQIEGIISTAMGTTTDVQVL